MTQRVKDAALRRYLSGASAHADNITLMACAADLHDERQARRAAEAEAERLGKCVEALQEQHRVMGAVLEEKRANLEEYEAVVQAAQNLHDALIYDGQVTGADEITQFQTTYPAPRKIASKSNLFYLELREALAKLKERLDAVA